MVSWYKNSFSDGLVDLVAGDMKAYKHYSICNLFVNTSTKKALSYCKVSQSYMKISSTIIQNP